MVTIKARGLQFLVLLTFVVAVVTLIRNMEYVIVFSNRHYTSVSFTLNRMNVRHDTGTCAVAMAFTNESHSAESQDCKVPTLDPFHPGVMQNIRRVKSITCEGIQYTEYEKNVLRLRDDVSKENQIAEVFAEPINRVSDSSVALAEKRFLDLTRREVKVNGDFLKVTVRFKDGSNQTDFHASISEIPDVAQRKETHSAPLNIMILVLDRTSSAHFQRMLTKTYAFLKDQLDSIIFKSYSIVGENTTPAMSAFLTGKSLDENCKFREARKGIKTSGTVDEWPFIFKDLKRLGIATMWSEDQPGIAAFNLRLKGFKDKPSDHYGRTLWLTYDGGSCKNSLPQFKLQLQYLKSFMKSYPGKRKFGFTFLSDLCHRTANLLSAGDEGFLTFFESLKNENLLNDTMFIMMSDHGPRYRQIRESPQGKLEHRLPFLSLTFPSWFKRSFPQEMAALTKNTRIISSPFDLYATMKHLLTFPEKTLVERDTIGKSLFEPLPDDRKCEDTGIPDNYCPCLRWKSIDISHTHVHQAVKVAVNHINGLLMSHPVTARLCHQLELKAIFEAHQKMPSRDTFTNFLADQNNTTCSYQIKFQTTPGDGLFEGLLKMNATGSFKVFNEIDRVSMYGNQPSCIVNHVPSMRPYCLCK